MVWPKTRCKRVPYFCRWGIKSSRTWFTKAAMFILDFQVSEVYQFKQSVDWTNSLVCCLLLTPFEWEFNCCPRRCWHSLCGHEHLGSTRFCRALQTGTDDITLHQSNFTLGADEKARVLAHCSFISCTTTFQASMVLLSNLMWHPSSAKPNWSSYQMVKVGIMNFF